MQAVVLCDQVIQDAITGKKTLVGLFDRIFARGFPVQHPQMTIFAKINGAADRQVSCTLRLVSPGGQSQDLFAGDLTMNHHGQADFINILGGLPLPGPGSYRFVILVDGAEAGEAPLAVELVQQGAAQPQTPPAGSTIH